MMIFPSKTDTHVSTAAPSLHWPSPPLSLMKVECVGEESHRAWLHTVRSTEHLCTCTTHQQRRARHYSCWGTKDSSQSRATLHTLSPTSGHSLRLSLILSRGLSLTHPLTWRWRLSNPIGSPRDHYLWHFCGHRHRLLLRLWSLWLTLLWCSPGRSLRRPPERKEVSPESDGCLSDQSFKKMSVKK